MWRACLVIAGLLLAAAGASAGNIAVADRYLILTNPQGVSTAWRMISFLEQSLTNDGVLFDVEVFDKAAEPRLDLKSVFYNSNGSGKYRGYFMYPNLEAIGDLTQDEVMLIWNYQIATGARSAKFGVWITTMGFYPNFDASGSQDIGMQLTQDAPLGTSGIPPDAALTANGLWRTPGNLSQPLTTCSIWANDFALTGISAPCTPTAIVTLNASPSLGAAWAEPSVTGAVATYSDGREAMGFVHDCAVWSPTCLTLAHLATDWMANAPNATIDQSTVVPKPQKANVVMDHKVLILTAPGFTGTDFFERTLRAYGTPYDVYRFDKDASPRLDLQWLLWNQDGSAKYSSIMMYPNLEAIGVLKKSEVAIVWDFQKKTGARTVKFAAWPSTVGWEPNFAGCSAGDAPMTFTAKAPFGVSGIRAAAPLNAAGLYRCPGLKASPQQVCGIWAADFADTGLIPTCTPTSILETADGVVGTHIKYGDGRESLAFFFDCATWSPSCSLLGHFVLAWMTQNIIPGVRRALLTLEMDDFFLKTSCTSCALQADLTLPGARASVADLQAQIDFQEKTIPSFPDTPPGTDIKLELPFNGNGILIYADDSGVKAGSLDVDDKGCADVDLYTQLGCNCWSVGWQNCPSTQPDYCRTCTKDYPRPLGKKGNRVPALSKLATGWSKSILTTDPLAKAIIADTTGVDLKSKFFWSHHTFTHENMDNATSYDAQQQVRLGALMANAAHLDLASQPTFSSKCMVTPQISGLTNGDALAGLKSQGIECTVGDNTWAHLRNAANPYQMLYSTVDKNGYDGFAFLPRWATEIYFNCSTASQIESVYNTLYGAYYGKSSTIDDIVAREASRVARDGLLALRYDPHMMHQANMVFDSTGQSLATRWLKAVLQNFHAQVSWPVQSKSLDQLYALFKDRELRDSCRLNYRLEVTPDKKVKTLTIASGGGACNAPVITPAGATTGAGTFERIGDDAPTLTVPVAAGASVDVSVDGLAWALP